MYHLLSNCLGWQRVSTFCVYPIKWIHLKYWVTHFLSLLCQTLYVKIMPKKPAIAESPANFEEAMAELQQLVNQMEAGELALEESIAAYKRGSELVKYCVAQLDKVESQVKVLEGEMLKPFLANVGEGEL
jgi:exodeoxyribonuclease VII small subunit